jgi:hypothetical protein
MEAIRSHNELLSHAVRSVELDTRGLRASIETATINKGRRGIPAWFLPRTPRAWAAVTAFAAVFALAAALYLPRLVGVASANPLYRAAADNHRTCSREATAPDWARSGPDISQLGDSFVGQEQHIPVRVGGEYRLIRARVCLLHGERFLHLVYETLDGREASLFVGRRSHGSPPAGERSITLDGRIVQIAHASDLNLTSTQVGDHLLIAAAQEDSVAANVLLSALANIRA